MTVERHYHLPHERQTVPVRLVVTADPAQPGASAEWSSWWQERSQPPSVRTLVESSGDVLQRDAAQPRWTTQSLEDQKWSLALLRLLDARQVLTGAAQATNAEPRNPAARDPLRPRLEFDGPRLAACVIPLAHPRLGDVDNRVDFAPDGAVRVVLHRPDDIYWFD